VTGARKDEITAILKEQIKGLKYDLEMQEVGVVVEVGDGIARVYGLEGAMASEIVEFPNEIYGLVLNLEEESVGVALFGDSERVQEGDEVRRTRRVLETPAGEGMLGRVVDPLGRPIDGKGPIEGTVMRKAEIIAPGVIDRQPVDTPLQTGLKAIDAMTPIGRGQRELIIGDRRTGKADQAWGHGLHYHRGGGRQLSRPDAVPGALCRLCHGRALYLQRQRRVYHLR